MWRPSANPTLVLLPVETRAQPGWDLAKKAGPWSPEYAAAVEAGAAVIDRRFTFVGRTEALNDRPLPWNDRGISQLWRFHLHYFDYLFELSAYAGQNTGQRAKAAIAFVELATLWMTENPFAGGDGWHPYTVSRRLVNWIMACHFFAPELSNTGFDRALMASISHQARYLSRNLELDVRGNHLLANLRALLCCGMFLGGDEPTQWKSTSLEHLGLEVAEQVLPDGGHFERNPGYHLAVLGDLLDISGWLSRRGHEQPAWLSRALERMLDYLVGVLPASGELPMIKDTAWDEIPQPAALLAVGGVLLDDRRWKRSEVFPLSAAVVVGESGWSTFREWPVATEPIPSTAFPDTGHYVLRDDKRGDFLLFDAGEPCPPYLPAHAHADLLSFELSVAGRRVIVDSGVYEYARGPWRDYFRSTRAHNTVEVAGQNQSEVWGSFRTARQAKPGRVVWRPDADGVFVAAEHDGYARLRSPVAHRRSIRWQNGSFWLVVDRLVGTGIVDFSNYLHIHESLSVSPAGRLTWQVDGLLSPLWIRAFGDVSAELIRGQQEPLKQGWQSERFGELTANTVLVLTGNSRLPTSFGYAIAADEPVGIQCGGDDEQPVVVVTHMGREFNYPSDS